MTAGFRYGILSADDKTKPEMIERTDKDKISKYVDDNVLH